jgi:hypothetical protein
MKSGTSSLYSYLAQHPQILPSSKKEVHFFDNNFQRGEQWYRAHFPLKQQISAGFITGEASPLYLFNPIVANRIYELIPKVKLIAVLRNPTERAISHYFHEVRKNRENLPIMEALQAEETRLARVLQCREFDDFPYIHFSYKKRGIYIEQLQEFWQYFSKEQLLCLRSETLFEELQRTLREVFAFLEVDETFEVKDTKPRNVGRNREEVAPEVYEYLNDFFSSYNQELYQNLGQDFGW